MNNDNLPTKQTSRDYALNIIEKHITISGLKPKKACLHALVTVDCQITELLRPHAPWSNYASERVGFLQEVRLIIQSIERE